MSVTNGHLHDTDFHHVEPPTQRARSESELSDLNDIPPPRSEPQEAVPSDDDDALHDMATSEMDEDDDAPGEEDADYDVESPPLEQSGAKEHDRSTSEDSMKPGKRKSDADDDEFMKQNPELYGLRRSVRESDPAFTVIALTLLSTGPGSTYPPSGTCAFHTDRDYIPLTSLAAGKLRRRRRRRRRGQHWQTAKAAEDCWWQTMYVSHPDSILARLC